MYKQFHGLDEGSEENCTEEKYNGLTHNRESREVRLKLVREQMQKKRSENDGVLGGEGLLKDAPRIPKVRCPKVVRDKLEDYFKR